MNLKHMMIAGLSLLLFSCSNSPSGEYTTIRVKEVEQVTQYTYLLVKAKGPAYWVAVPTMDATPGETYHYQGGMVMQDFYSKELERTFDKVIFLEALIPGTPGSMRQAGDVQEVTPGSMVQEEKSDVQIERMEGVVTIAELYNDPDAFKGRVVRVTGEVSKFNAAIMERNWVHIQDGTEFEGKFDLTATSAESYEVGTIVTLEGTLAVDLDFGYGYAYEILLERATAVN
ncbi:MAG: DNA-binding protein [Bacteroidota bacterium]